MAWQPRANQVSWIKAGLFAACLAPLARLVYGAFTDRLGANPIETITRSTGWWTLFLLAATLAVTPLRRLSGANWLLRLRRMLGLFAFFYALAHFTTFIWFDHWFDAAEILKDVVKRPFVTVGFAAFLLLLPLAATSNSAMVRRLGRNWQRLHRLAYAIAVLGVLHFWWLVKRDLTEPILFALAFAALLAFRAFPRPLRSGA
ncbi:MAG: sulfoxide reductase heme-binding subunit YedZ [Proteobacteria bacterium]|nr:sulfoxide reductase heme-binding subunit YedZ [Pseudomonadota bacterium]